MIPRVVLAVLLLAPFAQGAPVPRTSPAPWNGSIVGTWAYRWGFSPAGEITFYSDGTYTSHHGNSQTYVGHWYYDGEQCGIYESRLHEDGSLSEPTWYFFTLAESRGGTLEGRTPGNTPVVLSERR